MKIIDTRLAEVATTPLDRGAHEENAELQMCVMEAVAYVAGEPWSDHPKCACPVITEFMVCWNDSLPSDEDRDRILKPLIPLIVGTRSTPDVEKKRSYMALDWLVHVFTPQWLDMVPALHDDAKALRKLDVIADAASAAAAGVTVRLASKNAEAAKVSAWTAVGAAKMTVAKTAVETAAGVAAGSSGAAWGAAGNTLWVVAKTAARVSAWAAAGIAAQDALDSTVAVLQASAVQLVIDMCEVTA